MSVRWIKRRAMWIYGLSATRTWGVLSRHPHRVHKNYTDSWDTPSEIETKVHVDKDDARAELSRLAREMSDGFDRLMRGKVK